MAFTAVLVAVLSIAGLTSAVSSPDVTELASSPLAAAPAVPAAKPVVAPKPVTKTVMIKDYTYVPASMTVNVGDTVTWTNMDTAPHTVTVTSGPEKFDSGNLQKGESVSFTFTMPGTYEYYCAVHPDMTASVTVVGSQPAPSEDPTDVPSEEPTHEPTDEPTGMPGMPMPDGDACTGLQTSVDVFLQHVYAAHLETSPFQQVKDILDLDQYVKTHTVLIENMLKPLLDGGTAAVNVFMQHVYAAHLETSLGQQVADAIDIDQYAKTHTVMIENMIKPLLGSDLSSC